MSHASYHQQQNLVLPDISLVFRNVTFPSAVAWNKLEKLKGTYGSVYGKYMRFYDSSGRATNLLLLNDSFVEYHNYTRRGRYTDDSTYTQSYDYTTVLLSLIFIAILWPIMPLLLRSFLKRMRKSVYLSLPLFWFYGTFGLVEKQLNLAARCGYLPGVEAGLKQGVDVNCKDKKDCERGLLQFLSIFLYFGPVYFPLFYFITICFGDDSFFERLLGVQVDGNADTPLIWAVRMIHLPVVKYLLQQNADVKKKNVSIFDCRCVILTNISYIFLLFAG